MGIARHYANLVEDERVREMIYGDISAEFERTGALDFTHNGSK